MSEVLNRMWTFLWEYENLLGSGAAIATILATVGGALYWIYRRLMASKNPAGKTLLIDQSASSGNVAIQNFGSVNVQVGPTQQETTVGHEFQVADLINRGIINMERSQLDDAEKLLREAWSRLPIRAVGNVYLNLGTIYSLRKNLSLAEDFLSVALQINRDADSKPALATTYANLGELYRHYHEFEKAEAYQMKALAIEEALGRKAEIANNYMNLGLVHASQCHHRTAEEWFNKSVSLSKELGITSQVEKAQKYIAMLRSCPNYP
ncbi:MAG: tetratricopeptide repeat protein [Candidatus Binatia bacterium]